MPGARVAPRILADANRHNIRGYGAGPSRHARGLLLSGVITRVYRPDDRPGRTDIAESRNVAMTCQVLIYAPKMRAVLEDVPVLSHILGINDADLWEPKAAELDLSGRDLAIEGGDQKPSNPIDMDGDHVVVGFLNDDLNQPMIVGRLPHPRTRRRPSSDAATLYKLERWILGNHFGVTRGGNIELDTTDASDGTLGSDGSETPTDNAGDVTLRLKNAARIRIEIDGSNTVIEADKDKVAIKADDVEINSPAPGDGVARIGDKTALHSHTMTHALTVTVGPTTYTVNGSITASSEEPAIAEGSGTVRAGD